MTLRYSTDIVIFGGGIAGLWMLNRLRKRGFDVVLLEAATLGGGQTIASQGIIHGGLKYALNGNLSAAANTIADMPERWRKCLEGTGEIDLRNVKLLSEHYYMWSGANLRSRLKTFLGSMSVRGRVSAVDKADYPSFFPALSKGSLYRLPDFVIDTPSLIAELAEQNSDAICGIDPGSISFVHNEKGEVSAVLIDDPRDGVELSAERFVFAAGQGNQALMEKAGIDTIASQTRPLHMVYVKKRDLPPVYVHCIGNDFSLTPLLTVTSHRDAKDCMVWYLGGELAESGVERNEEEQLAAAWSVTERLFPWVNLSDADWHCLRVDRAEARVGDAHRPDDASCIEANRVLVTWPTKLTLAPALADRVLERLEGERLAPSHAGQSEGLGEFLGQAPLARPCWD